MRDWPKVGEIRRRYDRNHKHEALYYIILNYNYNRPTIYEDGVYRTATVKYLNVGLSKKFPGEKDIDFMVFGEEFRPEAFMLDEKVPEEELEELMLDML